MYFLTYEDEQDPDCDLQAEGDADEGDDGGVEVEVRPLLQHDLQLGSVGHQQSHVQHALGRALLVGVVVHVQREGLGGVREREMRPHKACVSMRLSQ